MLALETEILEAPTRGLEDWNRDDAQNVDEEIKIEDEQWELSLERSSTTGYLTQGFVPHFQVQALTAPEMKESALDRNDILLAGPVEARLTEALQVDYDALTQCVMIPFLVLDGEVIVDSLPQGKMDSKLICKIETLTQRDIFMNASKRQVLGWQSSISPMAVNVECHVDEIQE